MRSSQPSPPETEAAVRALRPSALPTDTSQRFLLVLAAVTSASLYLFASLWFLVRGQAFFDAVTRCAGVSGRLVPGQVGTTLEQLRAAEQCRFATSREQAVVQVVGSLLVVAVAYLAYRTWPGVRERREHLAAPVPADSAELLAELDALGAEAGVAPAPAIRLDATNPAVAGFAYGTRAQPRLGVTGGLVVASITDPAAFRAVVRHELGHVVERDVPWTYYAVCVWWSFLALALVPVTLIFVVRDPSYVVRLGWRSLALAGLVALTIAALLRVRESYADARAAGWGSGADLARLLEGATEGRTRRPEPLRTHPPIAIRRAALADPDLLFVASGWAALAAGIAASTAQASIADVLYLVAPGQAGGVSAVLVAPLLAAVVCTSAWRVGLREAVRGIRLPSATRLGVGLGAGLAIGPILSIRAAQGEVASGAAGWLGYLIWALGQAVVAVLLVRWVVDAARLRVAASLAHPAAPRGALLWHIAVTTGVFALWLAASAQLLILLGSLGPEALRTLVPYLHLIPQSTLVTGAGAVPLLLVLALLVQPVRALMLAGGPPAAEVRDAWCWRDPADPSHGEPPAPAGSAPAGSAPAGLAAAGLAAAGLASAGSESAVPASAGSASAGSASAGSASAGAASAGAASAGPTFVGPAYAAPAFVGPAYAAPAPARPAGREFRRRILASCAAVGASAGVLGGVAAFAPFLVGSLLDTELQASDAFLVVVLHVIASALMAASVCAGVVAAAVLPRGWWPLGLLASLVALTVAGAGAWLAITAYRYGLIGVGGVGHRPLGWAGTLGQIIEPGLRALLPTVLAMAVVGMLRPRRAVGVTPAVPVTAAAAGATAASAMPVPPVVSVSPPPMSAIASVSAERSAAPADVDVDPPPTGARWLLRSGLGAAAAALAAAMWVAIPVASVLGVSIPRIEQPGYSVTVPLTWEAAADPQTGATQFQTVAQDLLVLIAPSQATATTDLGRSIRIGGLNARLVETLDDGAVRWLSYRVEAPQGPHVVLIRGTPDALAARSSELAALFSAITWTGA